MEMLDGGGMVIPREVGAVKRKLDLWIGDFYED
jgi:hypothetical protein